METVIEASASNYGFTVAFLSRVNNVRNVSRSMLVTLKMVVIANHVLCSAINMVNCVFRKISIH